MPSRARSALYPLTLATAAALTAAAGCSSAAPPGPELTSTTQQALTPWTPGPALITRLQILGRLPLTARKLAGMAYFKDLPPQNGLAPSMSLGLVLNDGLFYSQGFGLTLTGQEPTGDTLYRIGSLTKLFTAAAVLKYIEDHPSVSLADPVMQYYIPVATAPLPADRNGQNYPSGVPAACDSPDGGEPCDVRMRIRDLISHTAGIPASQIPWGQTKAQFDGLVAVVPLDFYPGFNREYSNADFEAAGRLLETLSGENYDAYLKQAILTPLGMTRTVFDWRNLGSTTTAAGLAPGFNEASTPQFTGQNVKYTFAPPDIFKDQEPMWAAGGLYSTVADMAKFIQMELSSNGVNQQAYPLTTADLSKSQLELLPAWIPPSPNNPCVPCAAAGTSSASLSAAECGAAWYLQYTPPTGYGVLGNWVAMAGDVSGYGAPIDLAPSITLGQGVSPVGIGVIGMLSSNPDVDSTGQVSNSHANAKFNMVSQLETDAAQAVATAEQWTNDALPSVVEGLMSVINNWDGTTQAMTQLFSPTLVTRFQGALPWALASYSSTYGTCNTFTVQRINSATSATVTLVCAHGNLPIAIASSPSMPFQVTGFSVPSTTASAPGTLGLEDGIAIVGGNGTTIPVATSNGDGTWNSSSGTETSGDTGFTVYATQGSTPVRGDFDGDGLPDLALTGGSGWNTIPVAFGNVNGTFHGTNGHVTSGYPLFTTVAAQGGAKPVPGDFDGDGYSDVALTGGFYWNTIPVAFSNGDGTFRATNYGITSGDSSFPGLASSGAPPVWGDFNDDHKSDIVIVGGGWNFLPVAYSNGDGTFTAARATVNEITPFLSLTTQTGVQPVAGDFDGNGYWDIGLVGASAIHVAFGQAGAKFNAVTCTMSGDTNFPVYATQPGAKPVAGDFDGDGRWDIALTGGTAGWNTMPVAFSTSVGQSCTLKGTNQGASDGTGTAFPVDAAKAGARPVSMR